MRKAKIILILQAGQSRSDRDGHFGLAQILDYDIFPGHSASGLDRYE